MDEATLAKLHSAVRWDKSEAEVADIIHQAGVDSAVALNAEDAKNGNRCLHIAAQNGHEKLVKFLLKEKADPNVKNFKGQTALHMAVEYDFYFISVMLMDAGADPKTTNAEGHEALMGIEGSKQGFEAWDNPVTILKSVNEENTERLELAFSKLEKADPTTIDKASLVQTGMMKRRSCRGSWNPERFTGIVRGL